MLEILGGLVLVALFLTPALLLSKKKTKKKWPGFVAGGLKLVAGLGLIPLTVWLVDLLTGFGLPKVAVGVVALLGLVVAAFVVAIGMWDGKMDDPEQWSMFLLACLLVAVLMTGDETMKYINEQFNGTTDTIKAKIQ
ncbi:hypothetical protein AB0K21_22225 [Streptosporangium sp. NPDC049248]|uniref:hypothetical protein n=1 Tax=Streptosporangium sp. NPDC049248 TaxID=3155651 RepID=UPI003416F191